MTSAKATALLPARSLTRRHALLAFSGYFIVLGFYLPLVLLGQNAALPLLDWLDGDITGKMLLAQNLSGIASYFSPAVPQMMQGTAVWANTPSTLLYAWFSPYTAFLLECFFVLTCAYAGMLLLLGRLLSNRFYSLCVASATLFACLPFYLVLDLNAAGLPLLLWALLCLWRGTRVAPALLCVLVFGAFSSLAFTGYFVLGFLALFLLFCLCRKWLRRARFLVVAFCILTAEYLLFNLPLLLGLFGVTSTFVSHRTVYAAAPAAATQGAGDVVRSFLQLLLHGQYHAGSAHFLVLLFCSAALFVLLFFYRRLSAAQKKLYLFCGALLCTGVFIAAFYALCSTAFWQQLLQLLGKTLGSFQFDRLYFLYPALWYTLLPCVLALCLSVCSALPPPRVAALARLVPVASRAACAVVLAACFAFILRSHYETGNWRALLTGTQENISWHNFFAQDTFAEIHAALADSDEPPCVVSLGMSPAIALQNGFDTLDGYTNNYALSYHTLFGAALQPELAKSPALAAYYNNWGNRCYLLSAQLGKDFTYTKDKPLLTSLAFDWDVLRALGGTHLLSIAPVDNPAQYGLTAMGVYGGAHAAYRVYLYKL